MTEYGSQREKELTQVNFVKVFKTRHSLNLFHQKLIKTVSVFALFHA